MTNQLTTEEIEEAIELTQALPPGVDETVFRDPDLGPLLRVYLALTGNLVGEELTPLERLYERYRWFAKLKQTYEANFGPDAGMEQQASQILEQADVDFDWDVIAEIESAEA